MSPTREEWRDWAEAIEAPRIARIQAEAQRMLLKFLYHGAQQASPEMLAQMNIKAQAVTSITSRIARSWSR